MENELGQQLEDLACEYIYTLDANCEEFAASKGLVVVFPSTGQLQIDIDNEEQLKTFYRRLEDLRNTTYQTYEVISMKPSSSGKPFHLHITIEVQEPIGSKPIKLTEAERICLQFTLGSDPIRETINVLRYMRGSKNPTRLFEKP